MQTTNKTKHIQQQQQQQQQRNTYEKQQEHIRTKTTHIQTHINTIPKKNKPQTKP